MRRGRKGKRKRDGATGTPSGSRRGQATVLCLTCRGTEFRETDLGTRVCTNCGTEWTYVEEVLESDLQLSQAGRLTTRTVARSQEEIRQAAAAAQKRIDEAMVPELTARECLQAFESLLLQQARALARSGLCGRGLVLTVLSCWRRLLALAANVPRDAWADRVIAFFAGGARAGAYATTLKARRRRREQENEQKLEQRQRKGKGKKKRKEKNKSKSAGKDQEQGRDQRPAPAAASASTTAADAEAAPQTAGSATQAAGPALPSLPPPPGLELGLTLALLYLSARWRFEALSVGDVVGAAASGALPYIASFNGLPERVRRRVYAARHFFLPSREPSVAEVEILVERLWRAGVCPSGAEAGSATPCAPRAPPKPNALLLAERYVALLGLPAERVRRRLAWLLCRHRGEQQQPDSSGSTSSHVSGGVGEQLSAACNPQNDLEVLAAVVVAVKLCRGWRQWAQLRVERPPPLQQQQQQQRQHSAAAEAAAGVTVQALSGAVAGVLPTAGWPGSSSVAAQALARGTPAERRQALDPFLALAGDHVLATKVAPLRLAPVLALLDDVGEQVASERTGGADAASRTGGRGIASCKIFSSQELTVTGMSSNCVAGADADSDRGSQHASGAYITYAHAPGSRTARFNAPAVAEGCYAALLTHCSQLGGFSALHLHRAVQKLDARVCSFLRPRTAEQPNKEQ